MSDAKQRLARLVEPLRTEYPTADQIASVMCEIHDVINGKPGDPGHAYPLVDRVRAVVDEYERDVEELKRHRGFEW